MYEPDKCNIEVPPPHSTDLKFCCDTEELIKRLSDRKAVDEKNGQLILTNPDYLTLAIWPFCVRRHLNLSDVQDCHQRLRSL